MDLLRGNPPYHGVNRRLAEKKSKDAANIGSHPQVKPKFVISLYVKAY